MLKYIGGLQKYLCHTILLFNPLDLDQVYVQAQYLEAREKSKIEEKYSTKNPKGKDKPIDTIKKNYGKKYH